MIWSRTGGYKFHCVQLFGRGAAGGLGSESDGGLQIWVKHCLWKTLKSSNSNPPRRVPLQYVDWEEEVDFHLYKPKVSADWIPFWGEKGQSQKYRKSRGAAATPGHAIYLFTTRQTI